MSELGLRGIGAQGLGGASRSMSRDETNVLRLEPGVAAGYYEIYCLMLSVPASQLGAWVRYVVQAPPQRPEEGWCELWATVFDSREGGECFGLMREYGLDALDPARSPFRLRLGDGQLATGACDGVLEGGGHRLAWELVISTPRPPYLPIAAELYAGDRLPAGYMSPYSAGRFSGWIEIDGRRVELVGASGEQMHIWGRKHAALSFWAHCCDFDGVDDAELGLHGADPAAGGSAESAAHLAYLRLGEEEYQLLSLVDQSTSHNERGPGWWRITVESEELRIEAELSWDPALLVEAEYRDPDGSAYWVLHHDLCSCEVRLLRRENPNAPWQQEHRLVSTHTTQGEWGSTRSDDSVANRVLRLD